MRYGMHRRSIMRQTRLRKNWTKRHGCKKRLRNYLFRGLFLYVDACNRQRAYPEQKLLLILLHSPES